MITARTKKQLLVFLLITLVGVSYVGAKYAQLDRLIIDRTYTVTGTFEDSGGIFSGAEVTYRGVTVGRVKSMEVTKEGVEVNLDIENSEDRIPADTFALVGNRSAVGEQYVELQPNSDGAPYLKQGSRIEIDQTGIPILTTKLLEDTNAFINSVPKKQLRTVVSEFGDAFDDGGRDLTRLIESSTSFIETANENFDLTTSLINNSQTVLSTQVDKASAIRSFSQDLAAFSGTLAGSDDDLRTVISNGSATANQLRGFLEDNKVDLAKLINDLNTTGEVTLRNLKGLRMILVVYPYAVAGGYTVNNREPDGNFAAHFGLILNEAWPVCRQGYGSTDKRAPQNREPRKMNEAARCTESPARSNARGAQNARQRVAPMATVQDDAVATYDEASGELTFADEAGTGPAVNYTGGAQAAFGEESWKWLLLQPLSDEGR